METTPKLNEPLPLFRHKPREQIWYLAGGRFPMIFTIAVADAWRHEAVNQGPVQHLTTHPFGFTTAVASLADEETRRGLAETSVLVMGVLEPTLTLWVDFCNALAERLAAGVPLDAALANTWRFEDSTDVDLYDDEMDSVGSVAAV